MARPDKARNPAGNFACVRVPARRRRLIGCARLPVSPSAVSRKALIIDPWGPLLRKFFVC